MIPLWGVNITQNKKNEIANGRELVVATTAKPIDVEQVRDRARDLEAKASLPKLWGIVQWICGLATMVMAGAVISGSAKIGIAQAYGNAPAIFWMLGGFAVIFIALKIWGAVRNRAVVKSGEIEQLDAEVHEVVGAAYEELGVPEDAVCLDAFVFR